MNVHAETVLKSMGGKDFVTASGARDLVPLRNGLQFDIPGRGFTKQSINRVEVLLDPYDTYTMRFYRGRRSVQFGFRLQLIEERMNVQPEVLASTFKDVTGLATGA